MKTSNRVIAATATLLFASLSFADEKPLSLPGEEPAPEQTPHDSQWNVRVELLMVAMPQAKALAMIPDLRDPAKIEGAVAQILKDIDSKQATLMGYPMVETLDGNRAVSEEDVEKRYPTEFVPPSEPTNFTPPAPALSATSSYPIPSAFETRNVGTSLEVEPHVSANGDWITVDVVPQRVELLGFDQFQTGTSAGGAIINVSQPQFFKTQVTTTLKLRNGERCLIGVHKLVLPAGQIEFFIIQAFATPAK